MATVPTLALLQAALADAAAAADTARVAASAADAAAARVAELLEQAALSGTASLTHEPRLLDQTARERSATAPTELAPAGPASEVAEEPFFWDAVGVAPPGRPSGSPVPRRRLPRRIFILRHGESQGNVDESMYCRVPDPEIALTQLGQRQAEAAGKVVKAICDADGTPYRLAFYISPYRRSKQTASAVAAQFDPAAIAGVREEPQLREQDFGNFQDLDLKEREKEERAKYGRFFYRFPNGESGADVYDRLTVFEDHLVRDIDAGVFPEGTSIVLVTHGLALRVLLARWFHWTVAEYEAAYNPPNCQPLVMERAPVGDEDGALCLADGGACDPAGQAPTKDLYRLTDASLALLGGPGLGMEELRAMGSMLKPDSEAAWRRTLGESGDVAECVLP